MALPRHRRRASRCSKAPVPIDLAQEFGPLPAATPDFAGDRFDASVPNSVAEEIDVAVCRGVPPSACSD